MSGLQLGTCIAFHVIIGDLGPALLSKWLAWEVRYCQSKSLNGMLCYTVPHTAALVYQHLKWQDKMVSQGIFLLLCSLCNIIMTDKKLDTVVGYDFYAQHA